jgi:Vanillate O-demethylase oxygenase C-terminal domain
MLESLPPTARLPSGWYPVARSADVRRTPLPVGAAGEAYVPAGDVLSEPAPQPPPVEGPVFGNLEPSLAHAWHPVALSRELRPGGWLQVRLAGRTWSLHRADDGLTVDPPAFDVGERYGIVWLAPAEPAGRLLHVPEIADRRFVVADLRPVRAAGPAATLADTLLDEAHVTAAGGGEAAVVPPPAIRFEAGGFAAVRPPSPGDPYRTTTVVRAPFQLYRRVEDPVSGAATTVVFVLQPEDADSTRAFGCVLLTAGPGHALPSPAVVADAVASEQRLLDEDAGLQVHLASEGLPLSPRAEPHLATDVLGVALRRVLGDFTRRRSVGAA